MIDHSSRLTKPVVTHVSAAAVRCYGNCHVTSFLSTSNFARDAGECVVTEGLGHGYVSGMDFDSATVVPTYCSVVAGSTSPRTVDDCELAADAEVSWLLRHVAAATPLTPEIEPVPAFGGLRIASDEAPLIACVIPDFDSLPSHLATISAPCCGLRLSSRTVYHRDSRRRPCLNFDKMQVWYRIGT